MNDLLNVYHTARIVSEMSENVQEISATISHIESSQA